MKKVFYLFLFGVFTISSIHAQEFKIGINGGLPLGDIEDSYSFAVNLDASYLFEVNDVFSAGPSVSVFHYFGDSIDFGGLGSFDIEDATFLPIGGTARFNVSESFVLGADLGYGIGIAPDGNDGGFYYKPQAIYNVSENVGIKASYSGVSIDGGTFSSVNLGVEFGL